MALQVLRKSVLPYKDWVNVINKADTYYSKETRSQFCSIMLKDHLDNSITVKQFKSCVTEIFGIRGKFVLVADTGEDVSNILTELGGQTIFCLKTYDDLVGVNMDEVVPYPYCKFINTNYQNKKHTIFCENPKGVIRFENDAKFNEILAFIYPEINFDLAQIDLSYSFK